MRCLHLSHLDIWLGWIPRGFVVWKTSWLRAEDLHGVPSSSICSGACLPPGQQKEIIPWMFAVERQISKTRGLGKGIGMNRKAQRDPLSMVSLVVRGIWGEFGLAWVCKVCSRWLEVIISVTAWGRTGWFRMQWKKMGYLWAIRRFPSRKN